MPFYKAIEPYSVDFLITAYLNFLSRGRRNLTLSQMISPPGYFTKNMKGHKTLISRIEVNFYGPFRRENGFENNKGIRNHKILCVLIHLC